MFYSACLISPQMGEEPKKRRHPRYLTYLRWRDGYLPNYVPTFADIRWLADDADTPAGDALEHLSSLLGALGVKRSRLGG